MENVHVEAVTMRAERWRKMMRKRQETEQNEDLEKKERIKVKWRKGRVRTWLEGSVLSKQTEIEAVITPCVTGWLTESFWLTLFSDNFSFCLSPLCDGRSDENFSVMLRCVVVS